ncbi:NADH-quinone oxidoreductase subunit NuoH [Selenihalanaerobacter shriftii]|uniref:NADH-quinone oxidoreductase subunit H n=1 Tax=Selenihalanaerobacter shriftii TaxID=142842 RepID=A0A1T4LVD8_9FIRM|nr:NADH-quinone oxidoreductase subunit NuoH [Selenihalanaerobacter shriftii]SJZ58424.1 NADH dehydrogenase subunit H [Selenihalanaerobacter shriftii]
MEVLQNLFVNIAQFLRNGMTDMNLSQVTIETVMDLSAGITVLGVICLVALYLVYAERKVSAFIQMRLGPNRVGPRGLLQTVADSLKLVSKEDIIPERVDKIVYILAPIFTFIPAVLAYAVIPFGKGMIPVDLNIGIFYFIAVGALGTIPLIMAGWSSNNKYSLLGAMRSLAQMLSYEVPLVFSILGVVMITSSLRMSDIINAQSGVWFIVLQPLAFIIYVIVSAAETNRAPFDLPEGESELIAGYMTEYSGMRWAIFFLAEYAHLFAAAAMATTLFLGGWRGPILPSYIWFTIKTAIMIYIFMWVRWTFPRIRIDQLLSLGWKILLPLSLANVLGTGVILYLVN